MLAHISAKYRAAFTQLPSSLDLAREGALGSTRTLDFASFGVTAGIRVIGVGPRALKLHIFFRRSARSAMVFHFFLLNLLIRNLVMRLCLLLLRMIPGIV